MSAITPHSTCRGPRPNGVCAFLPGLYLGRAFGTALGAAGVHEAIYSLIMLREGFIAPSANIQDLDEGAEGYPIVRERMDNQKLDLVMSNSFGFGGTNASLVFKKV